MALEASGVGNDLAKRFFMKLSVHLVSWNGAKYIPYLFESLRNQTFKDWGFLVLDNHSADGTVEVMKRQVNNLGVQAQLMENQENLGFAGGHNQLWQACHPRESGDPEKRRIELDSRFRGDDKWEYLLLLNQDIYLMPDCLEKLVKFMDEHPEAAVVSPRLMKWDINKLRDGFTEQIDSLGLKVFRNRRVMENEAGKLILNIKFIIIY